MKAPRVRSKIEFTGKRPLAYGELPFIFPGDIGAVVEFYPIAPGGEWSVVDFGSGPQSGFDPKRMRVVL